MGLSISHGCFNGPYSLFNAWRVAIGKAAGRAIVKVTVNPDRPPHDTIEVNWDHIDSDDVKGLWNRTPDDPLDVLFAHSDCDGVIQPAQAGPLHDALIALLPKLDHGVAAVTVKFVDGLKRAVVAGENVEFR